MSHLILIILNNLDFSRQRKRRKQQKHWAKPTMNEQEKAKSKIINTHIKVCGVCWRDIDNIYDVWIECDYCGLWVHLSCTNNSNIEGDNIFNCQNCQ